MGQHSGFLGRGVVIACVGCFFKCASFIIRFFVNKPFMGCVHFPGQHVNASRRNRNNKPDNSMQSEPDRYFPFEGVSNFRDFGGYLTADGRRIKWRKLFRSGHLANLTPDDAQHFDGLDIGLIFDFRSQSETKVDANNLPKTRPPRVINLPINPGSASGFVEKINNSDLNHTHIAELMCSVNQEFVFHHAEAFRAMFKHLLEHDSRGALIHCAIGKDRTGFAVAMILAVLGVPKESIVKDYMLTGNYLNIDDEVLRIIEKYSWGGNAKNLRPVLEVKERYLRSAFNAIDENFSSFEHYLEEALKLGTVEREALKDRYLELV